MGADLKNQRTDPENSEVQVQSNPSVDYLVKRPDDKPVFKNTWVNSPDSGGALGDSKEPTPDEANNSMRDSDASAPLKGMGDDF